MVELMAILSSPLSNQIINRIKSNRTKIDMTTIYEVQKINPTIGFSVQNTNPRTILFGNNMKLSQNNSCNCANLICDQIESKLINLKTTTLDPERMRGCNENKWMCGTTQYVHLTSADGETASYNIGCSNSTDKCFRLPKDARFESR
jgi:hypothetical protein